MGFYLRMLEEGENSARDDGAIAEAAAAPVTIAEFHHTFAHASDDLTSLPRLITAPGLPE